MRVNNKEKKHKKETVSVLKNVWWYMFSFGICLDQILINLTGCPECMVLACLRLLKSYRVSWMHGLGMSPSAWENGTGSFRLVQSTKQTHRIHPCSFHFLFVFCLQQDIRWLLVLCLDAFPDIWPDLACIFSSFCRVPAGLDITHRLYGVLRSSDFVLLDANTKIGGLGENIHFRMGQL